VPLLGHGLNHQRIEIEAKPRSENRRAEHSHGISTKRTRGSPIDRNDALLQIAQAPRRSR
jgi:hypothetical protein